MSHTQNVTRNAASVVFESLFIFNFPSSPLWRVTVEASALPSIFIFDHVTFLEVKIVSKNLVLSEIVRKRSEFAFARETVFERLVTRRTTMEVRNKSAESSSSPSSAVRHRPPATSLSANSGIVTRSRQLLLDDESSRSRNYDASDNLNGSKTVTRSRYDLYDGPARLSSASGSSYGHRGLSEVCFLIVFIYFVALSFVAVYVHNREPTALTLADAALDVNRDVFIEERARKYLRALTSLGPRPTGSYENEVLAVEYLLNQLRLLQAGANRSVHDIQLDVQRPSGSFNLDFQDGFTSSYVKVKNILVKLEPKRGANHSVMINCHYDSVPGSPGASDDAVSCAVMLEVLRLLSQSDRPFRHTIILSFNGAEENILQASHGFITQHPWAKKIKAFINLDSCGSGGRELLFQAGPENPWLIELYGRGAKYPFACVLAQEVFQSGKIVPGDTDFRIFRDYGHIPGLDIAYIKNGYVYHTKFDSEEYIPPGSVQRAGENVHGLIRELANSELVADPKQQSHGNVIFFDFFGLFLVVYSEFLGGVLIYASLAIVVYRTYLRVTRPKQLGFRTGREYTKVLLKGLVTLIGGWVSSLVVLLVTGLVLNLCGAPMSWFTNQYLAFGLYLVPAMLAMIVTHLCAHRFVYRDVSNPWLAEQLSFESHQWLWCTITVALYFLNLKTSMVLVIGVLFPALFRFIGDRFIYPHSKHLSRDFLFVNLVAWSLPLELSLQAAVVAVQILIPLMGRTGPVVQPDIFIAVVFWIISIISYNFTVSFVHAKRSIKYVVLALAGIFLLSFFTAVFTPIGNPFSGDLSHPTPQRFMVLHVQRTFHDRSGDIRHDDSGIWVLPVDFKGERDMYKYFPELVEAHQVDKDCDSELMCGQPFYYPALYRLRKSVYLEGGKKPSFRLPLQMKLVSQNLIAVDVRRLTFNLTGPSHMAVYMSPAAGVDLIKWSLGSGEPYASLTWDSRPTYFVYHSQAEIDFFTFWVDIKVAVDRPKQLSNFHIAAVAHHFHGPDAMTPELERFVNRFPNWTYIMGWPATYESWTF